MVAFIDPEGRTAVGGLTVSLDRQIRGDIDGKELVFLVPVILLSDLIGRVRPEKIRQGRPSRVQTAATRRLFPYRVGAEPGRTIARFPQPLDKTGKVVHWHCLTESETLGKHPLGGFNLTDQSGTRIRPGWVQERIIPRIRWFLRYLRLEERYDFVGMGLGDAEEGGIGLVVGIHQEVGDQVGIVAGVVGEDVRRQRVYGFGRLLSRKIVATAAVSLPRAGRRASSHGPKEMELTVTNA